MVKRFQVDERIQLAHFLKKKKIGASIKGIRKALEKNCCKVNGRIERFGSAWLPIGAIVEFVSPVEENVEFQILYEDEEILIVNKPVGFVCAQGNCTRVFGKNVLLVHRLDKDTTGAFLLAKSGEVKKELISLFSSFKIKKEYLAIVDGIVRKERGVVDTFLSKKRTYQGQSIWGSSKSGLRAVTHFKVLKRSDCESLVHCIPITGRTHQIRVHMAEMGHPILGDRQYGKNFVSNAFPARPLLHAYRLNFIFHGKQISINCPPPIDFFL